MMSCGTSNPFRRGLSVTLIVMAGIAATLCSSPVMAQGNKAATPKTKKKPEPPPHVPERHQKIAKMDAGTRVAAVAKAAQMIRCSVKRAMPVTSITTGLTFYV